MANKIGIHSLQVSDNERGGTVAWDVGGTLTFTPSGEVGEIVASANKAVAGVKVSQMAGKFDVEGIDGGRVPVATVQSWRDVTAVASLANGATKTLVGSCTGQPELDVLEGKLSFVLEGVTSEIGVVR